MGFRNNIQSILCGSGQHQEMLQQALDIFGLIPDIDLKIMTQKDLLEEIKKLKIVLKCI